MKRILMLILALTFVLSAAACGTMSSGGETETSRTDTSAPAVESETEFFPHVSKQDYHGKEFSIISFVAPGEWYYAEKTGGGVLNDAIYAMNVSVEEYLGVDLVYTHLSLVDTVGGGAGIYQKIEPSLMAGDDEYQLCLFEPFYSYYSMIHNNLAYDLYTLPGIDLDREYWNRNVMDSVAIGDRAYIGLSDLCQYETYIFYCNKELFTDAKRTIPYQSVRNGTWTQEEFYTLTQGLYEDADGDGTRNNQDVYGFASYWDTNMAGLLQGSDIYVGQRNEQGQLTLALNENSEKLINFYDQLYRFSTDPSVWFWGYTRRHDTTLTLNFDTGRAYVTMDSLGTKYADLDFDFGILPVPKYDTAQESYAHLNWGRNFMVPSTVRDPAMVGAVIELMSYYSGKDVYETYYKTVLGSRVADMPDDYEMIQLVCNTIVSDPAMPWCDNSGELKKLIYLAGFGPLQKYESITSYVTTYKKSASEFLENMFAED